MAPIMPAYGGLLVFLQVPAQPKTLNLRLSSMVKQKNWFLKILLSYKRIKSTFFYLIYTALTPILAAGKRYELMPPLIVSHHASPLLPTVKL